MNKHEKARTHSIESFELVNGVYWIGVKSSSGETYSVKVDITCTCKFSSVQGMINGKLCSHQIAAMDQLGKLI